MPHRTAHAPARTDGTDPVAPEPVAGRLVLRTGLDVTPPSAGQPYATIYDPARDRYCRVRAPEFAVLGLCDGSRTLLELETELADRYPPSWVAGFVRRAGEHGLLAGPGAPEDPEPGPARRGLRLEVVRPTLVRVVWDRPERLFAAVDPLRRVCASAWGLLALAVTGLWGLVAFVVHAPAQVAALSASGPVPALVLVASVPFLMAAHELAHGLALRHLGGRVRGVGVMLLHFLPAAFCDVTDAWRLPRGRRALVALAGPACNLVLAGVVAVPLSLAGPGTGRDVLALLLTVNVGMALWNLLPVVRFDGYWVLVALTDVPNLMDRSRVAARQLLHGRAPAAGVALALYGLATYLAPPLVVAAAAVGYRDLLLGLGTTGALAWLALVALAGLAVPALLRSQGRGVRLAALGAVTALLVADALDGPAVADWLAGEALGGL